MNEYAPLLSAAAAKYGVPLNMLTAQMQAESAGNPLAVSPVGATGLMQIIPSNYSAYGVTDPTNPAQSIDAGAHMDADAYKRTGNWPDALREYHGGTDRKNWGPKTQAYEAKIMAKAMPSDADWADAMGAGTSSPAHAASVPDDASWSEAMNAPVQQGPGVAKSLGAGLGAGFGETVLGGIGLVGKGMRWLGNEAATPTLSGLIAGQPQNWLQRAGNYLVNGSQHDIQALESQNQPYADAHSGWNMIGKIGGEVVASAPVLDGAGDLIAGGLKGAGAAAGDTAIGNALSGVGRLADGTAGASNKGLPRILAKGASMITRGAAAGAGFNGLTGGDVVKGAEAGAIGAPVAAVGGKVVGAVARPILSAAGNMVTDLSPTWTESAAAGRIRNALVADGITPDQVISEMRKMGPDATPIDAASKLLGAKGGGNLRNMAEVAANSPGEGQAIAQKVLSGRMDASQARINQAVKAATGATGNIHGEASDLMAQRAAAAKPLYEKALAGTITPDARLQQFLNDPIFQAGLNHGKEIARLETLANGGKFNPADYASLSTTPDSTIASLLVDKAGNPVSVTTVPGKQASVSMRAADAAKRGLDDLLEQYRDPTSGRLVLDQRGRALNDVRNAYVKYLDQSNPDYAAARAAWAGPSSSLDALAMGRKALSNDAEVTASNVSRMSPSDRQFFLSGVTRALQDKIASAQDGADLTRKIFGNSLIRNRIAAAFDNPQAFSQFEQQMQNEAQYAATRNQVLSNSATARRLAGQADHGDIYGSLMTAAKHGVTGNGAAAASHAAKAAGEAVNFLTRPSERQLNAQSRLLFTQSPDDFASAMQKKPSALKNWLTGR